MRRLAAIPVLMAVTTLSAQAPPAFDVASVRQNTSGSAASPISITPGRLVVTNTPLSFVILHAFQLRAHEVVDVPDWAWSAAYDIAGTYPRGDGPDRWRNPLDAAQAARRTLSDGRGVRSARCLERPTPD